MNEFVEALASILAESSYLESSFKSIDVLMKCFQGKHHSNASDDPCFLKPVFLQHLVQSQRGSERKAMGDLNQKSVADVTGTVNLLPISCPLPGCVAGRATTHPARLLTRVGTKSESELKWLTLTAETEELIIIGDRKMSR